MCCPQFVLSAQTYFAAKDYNWVQLNDLMENIICRSQHINGIPIITRHSHLLFFRKPVFILETLEEFKTLVPRAFREAQPVGGCSSRSRASESSGGNRAVNFITGLSSSRRTL